MKQKHSFTHIVDLDPFRGAALRPGLALEACRDQSRGLAGLVVCAGPGTLVNPVCDISTPCSSSCCEQCPRWSHAGPHRGVMRRVPDI